jgi:hypothetical protein
LVPSITGGVLVVRAGSAFYSKKFIAAARRGKSRFSSGHIAETTYTAFTGRCRSCCQGQYSGRCRVIVRA